MSKRASTVEKQLDHEWAGRALCDLLDKSAIDAPVKLLKVLQELSNPHLVLELINALTSCGVAITIPERERLAVGKANKAENLKKARLVKTKKRLNTK